MPNVDVIVAPYEADAQLAYLSQNNLVDVVVTQDSDLIVFGVEKVRTFRVVKLTLLLDYLQVDAHRFMHCVRGREIKEVLQSAVLEQFQLYRLSPNLHSLWL
jgi:exonuclease-1